MRSPLPRTTVTLLLALSGCGGAVTATPSGRADSGSTRKDGGRDAGREAATDALYTVCPTSPPTAGARCAVPDVTKCEYGTDPEVNCDTLMDCGDGGWVASGPEDAGCSTTNVTLCPTVFSAITQGGECAGDAGGLAGVECYYPEARCWCTRATAPSTWQCDTAKGAGCPEPRPRIGTPCEATDANLTCSYDTCFPQVCRAGSWQAIYVCGK